MGHNFIYLVPFRRDVQVIISYQGLIDLAYRGGNLKSVSAEAVFEGDEFDVTLGTSKNSRNKPAFSTEVLAVGNAKTSVEKSVIGFEGVCGW